MDVYGLIDDVLELILSRLDSPIYLLRAASTCKRFYRIVAGSGFLHSYRSVHGPPAAYAYFNGNCQEFSRPDFSSYSCLDFLPDISSSSACFHKGRHVGWPKDRRGSLVLLQRAHQVPRSYQDCVVCEPLSRRYVIIPPIFPPSDGCRWRHTQAFLLDGNDGIGISNFKVLCAVWDGQGYRVFLFTSGGSWCEICIDSWPTLLRLVGFAEGSIHWHAEGMSTLLVVNRRTAKFECFLFPHVENLRYCSVKNYKVAVTEGSDGEARFVFGGDDGDMMVFARQQGSSEWVLEKRIQLQAETHGLPPYRDWFFYCAMPDYVHSAGTVLIRVLADVSAGQWRIDLDRETVELLDLVPTIRYPCELPWPPVLRDY